MWTLVHGTPVDLIRRHGRSRLTRGRQVGRAWGEGCVTCPGQLSQRGLPRSSPTAAQAAVTGTQTCTEIGKRRPGFLGGGCYRVASACWCASSNSAGGIQPQAEWSRALLYESMYSSVASSTSASVFQGRFPRVRAADATSVAPSHGRPGLIQGRPPAPVVRLGQVGAATRAPASRKAKRAAEAPGVRHWPLQALGFPSAWNPQNRRRATAIRATSAVAVHHGSPCKSTTSAAQSSCIAPRRSGVRVPRAPSSRNPC
jgi:hypothetical protein